MFYFSFKYWVRFFGFAGHKPVVVYKRRGTRLIWITWRHTRLAHYRRTPISPNFNQGVEATRPVWPLKGSYNKVSTAALFLLNCSGLLPIPGHVISVSRRRRRGSGVRHFGAKETQPVSIRFFYTHIAYHLIMTLCNEYFSSTSGTTPA